METPSPKKKLKSPVLKSPLAGATINSKTSITCSNVPEGLFEAVAAKKHFSKFGRVQRIRLFPKKQMCIIEYDQPTSVDRALLNAGAFDGFMFDVTRFKPRVRRKSKKEEDPDWVPDSDVEEELSAMGGAASYTLRQKQMDIEPERSVPKILSRVVNQSPIRKRVPAREKPIISQPKSGIESPVLVSMPQTTLSTAEAAAELHQLRNKVSLTPDEQWRILDARDRILRSWGGAGARVKVGGATIGTCPDMCPEKERLHRQAEHQVMSLETVPDCDFKLEQARAVKQYSRSSADQEIPMCYELRPPVVLERTCAYLLAEIADTTRPVTLADWFHFMWDRFRGIRKDITQQALSCAESIRLVEMCARFHAHCAARLADLEHTQFDQKLNTDNLTKCLQTLKHMYADVTPEQKPLEAEFRGYIALLNLGDANFWWEIKQLPQNIQKSEAITFAIKIFNALDNNNYVRFFRLVKESATYLQACILLRYFNDVRARALARIVKGFAPRGGSRYPAYELMNALAFESIDNMKAFVNHYGLRFAKTDEVELTVILDRNDFIEDSDPYPIARALQLIESKRQCKVGSVIAGGPVPTVDFGRNIPYTSFNKDGTLKEEALTALDQGYNTLNDSNKDVRALKSEIQRLAQTGRVNFIEKAAAALKPETRTQSPGKSITTIPPRVLDSNQSNKALFLFKPAIPVAPIEVIANSPEKIESPSKNLFKFSQPQESKENIFGTANTVFGNKTSTFGKSNHDNELDKGSQNIFKATKPLDSLFQKPDRQPSVFGKTNIENRQDANKNIFNQKEEPIGLSNQNVFGGKSIFSNTSNNLFSKSEKGGNIFEKPVAQSKDVKTPSSIFGSFKDKGVVNNVMNGESYPKSVFTPNGDAGHAISPGSLFKNACETGQPQEKINSIFRSKNNFPTVPQSLFNSGNEPKNNDVYEFNDDEQTQYEIKKNEEERIKQEQNRLKLEEAKKEEERRQELKRQEEKRRQDEQKRILELKRIEEDRRKEEERRQEELRKKIEEERNAELKRKAEEEERQFNIRVEKESVEVVDELINEVSDECVQDIMKDELDMLKKLMLFADTTTEEVLSEICSDICHSEMLAEQFLTQKLMRKWFNIWRQQFIRNIKRRSLLEDTPVWLTEKTPVQEANILKRMIENATLKNMNAIHRGYKFTGELRQWPAPKPYNIMEIIKSSLLKRIKQLNCSYDKGLFWKITVVSPNTLWMYRKINLEKWLLEALSDKKEHEISRTLIYVQKQTWNQLIDFSISVCLKRNREDCCESIEGTNGLLFYNTDNQVDLIDNIQDILKSKYAYQVLPVAIVTSEIDTNFSERLQQFLEDCIKEKCITCYKIFVVDPKNVPDSLNATTESALKWLARNYPPVPQLEIDYVKSICERYLGNEIWSQMRKITDNRIDAVMKDLHKLVECYNAAVDRLTESITNEDLFNYPLFPLEFKDYLNNSTLYPKPYEFITSNVRNTENVSVIKSMMNQLKLETPVGEYLPMSVNNMQEQLHAYCRQIGWFQNPEKSTRAVSLLELSHILCMPRENFKTYFNRFDLSSFLNLIVYEKIHSLRDFENRFAIYEKSAMEQFRNVFWLYDLDFISNFKHKALDYEDDIDKFIDAKRRKIALDSLEHLMLEENDCTLVEENIREADQNISKYNNYKDEVEKLEEQIEEERKKSSNLERLLQDALMDA